MACCLPTSSAIAGSTTTTCRPIIPRISESRLPAVDWFENSRRATLAHRQACIDYATEYHTFAKDRWGLSPCMAQAGDQPGWDYVVQEHQAQHPSNRQLGQGKRRPLRGGFVDHVHSRGKHGRSAGISRTQRRGWPTSWFGVIPKLGATPSPTVLMSINKSHATTMWPSTSAPFCWRLKTSVPG